MAEDPYWQDWTRYYAQWHEFNSAWGTQLHPWLEDSDMSNFSDTSDLSEVNLKD